MRLNFTVLIVVLMSGMAFRSGAQSGTSEDVTIKSFERLQEKFISIAKDFPQELYDFQPHNDSRSYIREIWHVSSGFGVLAARIQGVRPSRDLMSISDSIKYDRDEIVKRLTKNSNECITLLKENFYAQSIFTLAHLSEHYGKLVTIYRVNNLIPPNSKD